MTDKDPTIANLLKARGYVTGQFGKNHLGDRNEHLPTVHGFDLFFGKEPENEDYPKDPAFKARFAPRGVLKCVARVRIRPRQIHGSASGATRSART